MLYKLERDIYLNKIDQCYKNIITITPPPDPKKDPYLHNITKIIHKQCR